MFLTVQIFCYANNQQISDDEACLSDMPFIAVPIVWWYSCILFWMHACEHNLLQSFWVIKHIGTICSWYTPRQLACGHLSEGDCCRFALMASCKTKNWDDMRARMLSETSNQNYTLDKIASEVCVRILHSIYSWQRVQLIVPYWSLQRLHVFQVFFTQTGRALRRLHTNYTNWTRKYREKSTEKDVLTPKSPICITCIPLSSIFCQKYGFSISESKWSWAFFLKPGVLKWDWLSPVSVHVMGQSNISTLQVSL